MKIYEVTKGNRTVSFERSFDMARSVVREDDPKAKKIWKSAQEHFDEFEKINAHIIRFSNDMEIIDRFVEGTKEGILKALNDLTKELTSQPDPEPVQAPIAPVSPQVSDSDLKVDTVVPAIEYRVDDLNFPKKGKGTCLHCRKQVGFVGGFPAVDPPSVICD